MGLTFHLNAFANSEIIIITIIITTVIMTLSLRTQT